jgi:biopolymer transport protein ExbD
MTRTVLAILVSCVSAVFAPCQDPGPLVAVEDLPTAKQAAAYDPAGALVVEVDDLGRIALAGRVVPYADLAEALGEQVADDPKRSVDAGDVAVELSERPVLLRMASGLGGVALEPVLAACARAGLYRIALAVRQGGDEMAFAIPFATPDAEPTKVLQLRMGDEIEDGGAPSGVFRPLRDAATEGVVLHVRVGSKVSLQRLVEMLDIADRAGIGRFQIGSDPTSGEAMLLRRKGLQALVKAVRPGRRAEVAFDGAVGSTSLRRFGGVRDEGRAGVAKFGRSGASPAAARAMARSVARGLAWLREQQGPDGGFGDDVTRTAFALQAFVADGNTMRAGPHREAVVLATKWLMPRVLDDAVEGGLLEQASATFALAEVLGLSFGRPLEGDVRERVEHAWARLAAMQSPTGGFPITDPHAAVQCLFAWRTLRAFGVEIDDSPARRTIEALAAAARDDAAPAGVREAALIAAHLSGKRKVVRALGEEYLDSLPEPGRSTPRTALHDGALGVFQEGGNAWVEWARSFESLLVATQDEESGAWGAADASADEGERVAATAYACLTLMSFYRYSRLAR